jgi:hypothetical protein
MDLNDVIQGQIIVFVLLFVSELLSFVTHKSLKDVNGILQLFLMLIQTLCKKEFSANIITKVEECQTQIQKMLPNQENEK